MKTTGKILYETRLNKKIELSDVSKATRIKLDYLTAIESDNYSELPNSTVAKGFIRNYSEFLSLNPDHVLAVFRRDFVENPQGQIVPRGLAVPVTSRFVWTPRLTLISVTAFILTSFIVYLIYQYRLLSGPPSLIIAQPIEGMVTTENIITISGKTDPEATISINNNKITTTGGGRFDFRWELSDKGEQQITLVAVSKSGKITSQTRTVIVR